MTRKEAIETINARQNAANVFTNIADAEIEAEISANIVEKIRKGLEARNCRSAWDKGVNVYAMELLDDLNEAIRGGWYDAENVASPRML